MIIDSFIDEYFFLSNFYMAPAMYDGIMYPSSEHAYQAAKFTDLSMRQKIKKARTPGEAKRLGRSKPAQKNWDDKKFVIMRIIVQDKFMRNRELGEKLLKTRPDLLIEGNDWGDRTWGCVKRKGEWVGDNWLGKILMMVREDLWAISQKSNGQTQQ